jgi:hypothetical protein
MEQGKKNLHRMTPSLNLICKKLTTEEKPE